MLEYSRYLKKLLLSKILMIAYISYINIVNTYSIHIKMFLKNERIWERDRDIFKKKLNNIVNEYANIAVK